MSQKGPNLRNGCTPESNVTDSTNLSSNRYRDNEHMKRLEEEMEAMMNDHREKT
jgi:hypothetical protein